MKHLQRVGAVSIGVILAASLAACGGSGDDNGSKTISLGVIDDFSGGSGTLGTQTYQGAQLAVDTINAAGGIKSLNGAKLTLKKYDTATDPNQAVPQANKLVQDKNVIAIGGHVSDTVIGGSNVTHRAHIPWIVVDASSTKITDRGFNDIFMVNPSADQWSKEKVAAIQYALKKFGVKGAIHVGMSYSQTSYGEDSKATFVKYADEAGFKIDSDVGYGLNTPDLTPIAQRMESSKPVVLFNGGYPADGISLTKIFNDQVTTKAKLLFTNASAAQAESELGKKADGMITFSAPNSDFKNLPDSLLQATAAFHKKFGGSGDMPSEAVYGYQATMMAAAGLEDAKSTDGPKIAAALHQVQLTHDQGSIMPQETFGFSATGTPSDPHCFLVQFQDGKQVGIWPEENAKAAPIPFR